MKRTLSRAAAASLIAGALWVAIGITGAQTACAHDPRFACSPRSAGNPIVIRDPSKSWAFYGRLSPGAQDVYTIHVAQRTLVPVALLIERSDASNAARPSLRMYRRQRLVTAVLFQRATPFYEPFSGTQYLTTPTRVLALQPGTYQAIVTMHGGEASQRYVMALGSEERFSIGEIPYVLGAILCVRERGY